MEMVLDENEVIASICKESFYEFVQEFWDTIIFDPPVLNWHIKLLCDELQAVAERVFKGEDSLYDLVINVPPGSTKSTICSQMFPAWVWTRMPHAQFICPSYAQAIATKDSQKTRDIIQSEKYQSCFVEVRLRDDENQKILFENTQKGYRLAAGVGGSITGRHGHFLIVDDPINPQEALSEADLKAVQTWMESTLPTRKVSKTVTPTILIQQRLHEADPSGILIARGGVRHICLPGEISEGCQPEPPDLARFYVDGCLDPVRSPMPVLKKMEKDMGAYPYAAQILQRPVPLGGGEFKVSEIRIAQVAPMKRMVSICRSWDKAGTEGGGAWSVGVLMGVDNEKRYWILDVVRGQWASTERERMIKQTAEVDGVGVTVVVEIEGGSGGKESGEATVANLAGYHVHTYHPTGDKVTRSYPLSSQVGAGNVTCVKGEWTKEFLRELEFFPNGRYKDQVDAASGGFAWLTKKKVKVGGWGSKK